MMKKVDGDGWQIIIGIWNLILQGNHVQLFFILPPMLTLYC